MQDHEGYKQSLIKILDMARESHWYLLDRVTARQFDLAKTYLWTSSVIGAIAMFMVKELHLSGISGILLGISVVFASISFVLSILILWGRLWGVSSMPLAEPLNFAISAYEHLLEQETAESTMYADFIARINNSNLLQRATNTRRANILRVSAPCLIVSFLCLMGSIVVRVFHV